MMETRWLVNPLTNPLFEPLMLSLLVLFGGVAIALVVLQQGRVVFFKGSASLATPAVSMHVLWQRYLTWAIIAPLFAGAALSGPLLLAGLCAFLCWQGGREYALLTGLPSLHRSLLLLAGWATLATVLLSGSTALAAAPILAFFGWSLLALRPVKGEASVETRFMAGLVGLWGYLYIGWLPAYLLMISLSKVPALLLLVGLGVALSDVGAFCTGKLLGGPKLAPRLSPGKTWGGVLGNFLGAALSVILLRFVLPALPLWQYCLFALAIGSGCIWGDLLESLLKRQRGVKDAGTFLPGFGGLLDRIDSLLFVAPLVYYLALLLLH